MAEKKKEDNNQKQRESQLELQIMQQQAKNLKSQYSQINGKIQQLEYMKDIILNFKAKEGETSFSEIGLGIFAETQTKKRDKFLINIGKNLLVKRTQKEIEEIISSQIKTLQNINEEILADMQKIGKNMQSIQQDLMQ